MVNQKTNNIKNRTIYLSILVLVSHLFFSTVGMSFHFLSHADTYSVHETESAGGHTENNTPSRLSNFCFLCMVGNSISVKAHIHNSPLIELRFEIIPQSISTSFKKKSGFIHHSLRGPPPSIA